MADGGTVHGTQCGGLTGPDVPAGPERVSPRPDPPACDSPAGVLLLAQAELLEELAAHDKRGLGPWTEGMRDRVSASSAAAQEHVRCGVKQGVDITRISLSKVRGGWWQVRETDVRVIVSFRSRAAAETFRDKAVAAAALVDRYFPRLGQCGLCGVPGEDQRHRVVDAVASSARAGEDPAGVFGVSDEAIDAALVWTGLGG